MSSKEHWERVYADKPVAAQSWFQARADRSIALLRESGVSHAASIIDIGGGASTFVDGLVGSGYTQVTVLDISGAALAAAKERLGADAERVRWREADVVSAALPARSYDVWHDRAVFHFLVHAEQRRAYVAAVLNAVKPGGLVIVATFAEDGPTECSGLPVMRYRAQELHAEFGTPFALLKHEKEAHTTPAGRVQQFLYCVFRKREQ